MAFKNTGHPRRFFVGNLRAWMRLVQGLELDGDRCEILARDRDQRTGTWLRHGEGANTLYHHGDPEGCRLLWRRIAKDPDGAAGVVLFRRPSGGFSFLTLKPSGSGPESALLYQTAATVFRLHMEGRDSQKADLVAVVEALDRICRAECRDNQTLTGVIGVVDENQVVTQVSAGGPRALVCREKTRSITPLAASPTQAWGQPGRRQMATCRLLPGDFVVYLEPGISLPLEQQIGLLTSLLDQDNRDPPSLYWSRLKNTAGSLSVTPFTYGLPDFEGLPDAILSTLVAHFIQDRNRWVLERHSPLSPQVPGQRSWDGELAGEALRILLQFYDWPYQDDDIVTFRPAEETGSIGEIQEHGYLMIIKK